MNCKLPLRCVHHTALAATFVLLLPACTNDASAQEEAASVKDIPAIHLDQTIELLFDGENMERAAYVNTIKACLAGGIPTTPLSDAEVALVGVTRYEFWADSKSSTTQTRSWGVGVITPDLGCHYKLEMDGSFTSNTATSFISQDLATGVREEQAVEDSYAMQRFPAVENEYVPDGVHGPVAKQVAGQPCDEWTSLDKTRQCVWSGGRAWGFGSSSAVTDHRSSGESFVLANEPGNGNGYRVTTQVLTVGQPFAAPTAAIENSP